MALVLVGLKLAIQRRALGRQGGPQRAFFVAAWIVAAVLGLAAGAIMSRLASPGAAGDLGFLLVLTVLFLGWALTPLLLPGLGDQTVDPGRLETYPISAPEQVTGLLLGGLIAPTSMFTFLTVAGSAFATDAWEGTRLVAVLAAILFTMLCLTVSRALQALLGGVAGSRRARDVVIGVAAALGLGAALLTRAAQNIADVLAGLASSGLEQVLGWLPSGAAGAAFLLARDGQWLPAALRFAVLVGALAVAAIAWVWAIRHRVKGSRRATTRRGHAAAATGLALVALPLAALPATPAVAVAAQTLRYYFFRQPLATQSVVIMPIIGVVLAHTMIQDGGLATGSIVFAVLLAAALVFNYFGFDDKGFAYLHQSGTSLRSALAGKALASLLLIATGLAVFVSVEAALNDAWSNAGPAMLSGLAVGVASAGVGAVTSVGAPRNRTRGGGPLASGPGALVGTLAGLVVVMGIAGVVLLGTLAFTGPAQLAVSSASLLLAAVLCWALLRWSGTRASRTAARMSRVLSAT